MKKDPTMAILEADQGTPGDEMQELKDRLKSEANLKNGYKMKYHEAEKRIVELEKKVKSENTMKSQNKTKLKKAEERVKELEKQLEEKPSNPNIEKKLREDVDRLENENAELVKDIHRLDMERDELVKKLNAVPEAAVTEEKVDNRVKELHEEITDLQKNNSKLKGLLKDEQEKVEGLVAQKIKLMNEKQSLEQEVEDRSNRIKDMKDDVQYLREQRKQVVDAFDVAEENLQDLVDENMRFKDTIAEMAFEIFGRSE